MKHLMGFVSFVLIAQGVGGIVHRFFEEWTVWTMVHRIGFLDGYEVSASIVLIVLGVAVGAASDKVKG